MSEALPQAFLERMAAQLGEELPAFLHSYTEPYCRGIRLNPLKPTAKEFWPEGVLEPVPWEPGAHYLTVESDAGVNIIQIEPGQIRILEADCPDQVCVQAGWLTDSAAPIVCLPHRLVIRLEKTAAGNQTDLQIDAVSQ